MEGRAGATGVFIDLWRRAARVLRDAEHVYIIGYSLPAADSAALTLLLTNCDIERVEVISKDPSANHRLRSLLSRNSLASPQSFEEWLQTTS